MKRKLLVAFMAATMLTGTMTGCGTNNTAKTDTTVSDETSPAVADVSTDVTSETTEIESETTVETEEVLATEESAQDNWYVTSGMSEIGQSGKTSATLNNIFTRVVSGSYDENGRIQPNMNYGDDAVKVVPATMDLSWNRSDADENGNAVYNVEVNITVPVDVTLSYDGMTDEQINIEASYRLFEFVDSNTGMVLPVLPQDILDSGTDAETESTADVTYGGQTYSIGIKEEKSFSNDDFTTSEYDESAEFESTYYFKYNCTITAPAEYSGLLLVYNEPSEENMLSDGINLDGSDAHVYGTDEDEHLPSDGVDYKIDVFELDN